MIITLLPFKVYVRLLDRSPCCERLSKDKQHCQASPVKRAFPDHHNARVFDKYLNILLTKTHQCFVSPIIIIINISAHEMPHVPPTIELLEHAQLQYRRKEYVKAIDLLDLAIKHEPSPSVKLLDTRAAAHEKLQDYKLALKDARTCIRIFEKDPTGYLRAAKVLQIMSKTDVALSIYKHGISKKVQNIELLQKMHDKLLLSLAPDKATDPFAQMPIEVVEMILSYLNFRQIVYCTRVSKQWKMFIDSIPGLWTDLDFSEAKKSVKSVFLSHCINTSKRKVVSATLKHVKDLEKVIKALTRSCSDFNSLRIIDGGLQGESLIQILKSAANLKRLSLGSSAEISSQNLPNLLLGCENLQDLECRAIIPGSLNLHWKGEFPKLRRLRLVRNHQSPNRSMHTLRIGTLLTLTPNLLSLSLNDWATPYDILSLGDSVKQLVELDMTSDLSSGPVPFPFRNLPQTIRVLRLDLDRPLSSVVLLSPKDLFLPKLEELVCCGADMASLFLSDPDLIEKYPDPEVNRFLRCSDLSKLHTLHVQCTGGAQPVTSLLSLPRLEHLRSLRMTHNSNINDEVAKHIASNLKQLQDVDLSSTMITGASVRVLVDGLKPTLRMLKFVNVWHCSPDAPEWAREQGIRVQYSQNSDGKPKGRKIRLE
jgi:F-box/TPR repeat protein Pof3